MQNNTVSVKELNKILNNEPLSGDYSDIDIVFVAGLFLWYMQHKDAWKKIPRSFNLTENDNAWNHSHYFKQIDDLYGVNHSQIFDKFPNAYNSKANPVSNFYAPPIYITKKSIDYFFGTEKVNKRIDHLKVQYIELFDISDFVNKTYNAYKSSIKKFEKHSSEIHERLKNSSPIFVFIFIVTYKRLTQKENRTFEETNEYIEKIWQFTKTYINGLHELAKNIVEHSGERENDGQGMITIRAYSGKNNDKEKIKVLETHVFDYGTKGIYKTLKLNTKKKITSEKDDDIYAQDYEVINNSQLRYTLKDFIEPTDNHKFLLQQFYREMAHYGLMNFKDLIEHYEGRIIASSVRDENTDKREQYVFPEDKIKVEEIMECDITKGTSYYFEMPFIPNLFVRKQKTSQEPINQDVATALSDLQKFKLIEYLQIDENFQPVKNKIYLIDFKVSDSLRENNSDKIDSREIENRVCNDIIGKLNSSKIESIKDNLIAIDFENITVDKSNLLRILAKLSREKLSDFIVYNIDSEILERLIEDNKNWFKKVQEKWVSIDNKKLDTSYWLKEKSILFFTKYEIIQENAAVPPHKEKIQKDYFYFADILFGETPKSFNSINAIVSKTFPSTTFVNKQKDFEIDEKYLIPTNLQKIYFSGNSNYLLPFDTILKYKDSNSNDEKELFLFNIRLILQNELLNRKSEYDNTDNYVRNFDGYRISQTHFKIGNKVHSADFYYAKRLFQNSFYTTRLAVHLAKQIHNRIKDSDTKITLAGYEMYSELILSLTEKFLRDTYKYQDVNHFVGQSGDNKIFFLPKNIFDDYLKEYSERKTVIIVPIAATGNTNRKIKNEIKDQILKYERKINDKTKSEVETLKENFHSFETSYNIILAQDPDNSFDDIKNNNDVSPMINLPAKWYRLNDCILCYGERKDKDSTKPLFETDNSSLTPTLIFGNPKGHIISQKEHEIENDIVKFDDIRFNNSLNYQSIARNDNYRIYDIDSDIFIDNNIEKLTKWFKDIKLNLENYSIIIRNRIVDYKQKTLLTTDISNYKHNCDKGLEIIWFNKYVKLYKENKPFADDEWLEELDKYIEKTEYRNLKPTDKIIIVSPCHESNSKFINLINENIFSSSAIIIHHQNGVDFEENFNILNRNYLNGQDTKIFYVDDSLITGKHFFELFDLVRVVTENPQPLTAAFLLNDQAVPFIHDRAVRWSKNYFSFVTFNQPPTLNMIDKRPLEHEFTRYALLKESALHDIVREHFYKKTYKLNPDRRYKKENVNPQKQIRRLKMFEATHKIYDYFTKNDNIPDLSNEVKRKNFVDFKLKYDKTVNNRIDEEDINTKALLKVLSQYPFVFYKDLKTETFNWHKKLLKNTEEFAPILKGKFNIYTDDNDKKFSTFKFILRRSAFLSNYQVLEVDFLKILLMWFQKNDLYFKEKPKQIEQEINLNSQTDSYNELFSETEQRERKELDETKRNILKQKEENLSDFPIFVLGNYVEMIQKNPWVAHRIISNIYEDADFLSQLKKSKQGNLFLRMLQIESAVVIDEFMNMINKEYRIGWRDMYKNSGRPNNKNNLEIETKEIIDFFKTNPDALETNKYELVKKMFLNDTNEWIKKDSSFVNYLWTKQLLYADSIDKDSQINFGYQDEINAIVEKMIGFFPENKKVYAFFIVTDGQQKPYILSPQDGSILNEFTGEFEQNKSLEINIEKLNVNLKQFNKEDSRFLTINKEINKKQEEHKKIGTKVLIDFLIGKPCSVGNSTETTSEFIYEASEWRNIYTNEFVNLEFLPNGTKWLYLIRISDLKDGKDGKCTFDTEGLLGFYSETDFSQEVFSKQLLMLLRKDMCAFINKHHKSDEFAGLIQQKEKADYQFMLRHGIDTYEAAINFYKSRLKENNSDVYFSYFDIVSTWLTGKIFLISIMTKINIHIDERDFETFTLDDFVENIKKSYKYVFSFHNSKFDFFSDSDVKDVDRLVTLNESDIEISDKKNIQVSYPKKLREQIIFEIFYNIRKHVLKSYFDQITESNKVIIDLGIRQIDNYNCLAVSNNFCDTQMDEKKLNQKIIGNKYDGLNLISNILRKCNLGNIFIELKDNLIVENKKYIIIIPLNKIEK